MPFKFMFTDTILAHLGRRATQRNENEPAPINQKLRKRKRNQRPGKLQATDNEQVSETSYELQKMKTHEPPRQRTSPERLGARETKTNWPWEVSWFFLSQRWAKNVQLYHKDIQDTCSYAEQYHKNIQGTLAQPGLTSCHVATVRERDLHTYYPMEPQLCFGLVITTGNILGDCVYVKYLIGNYRDRQLPWCGEY